MKLEVFFDYSCPYCLRGHDLLLESLKSHPEMNVQWTPCEAHPRPEVHGLHSDLCARAMYIVQEAGGDIMACHDVLYDLAINQNANIEDPNVIATALSGIVDSAAVLDGLASGAYEEQLLQNNRLAWVKHGFFAVPSLYMEGKLLPCAPGIGLTSAMIDNFLRD